jgi:serine/threonine protein kinase
MLTKSGVKVLDFGLAKSALDPSLTAASGIMGTPAYMAPERLEGEDADARSDVYALGLILAEMATGKRSKTPENLPPGLGRVVGFGAPLAGVTNQLPARELQFSAQIEF